ncbi:unnamed protein product [Litomosoides sigmodontis]|uniref:PDZ domain-containing protein n=1 Tax=Litomosoides sigmodontis TaxID=42156 RepID=A0A3P6UVK2_LITSI|nr:unnamed protein product [Litomosoides sigmodontis]
MKGFIAAIESNVVKSGKIACNERMDKMENKAVEAIIAPAFTDKMTSCSSLTCKREDDDDDAGCLKNEKVQQKQQERCIAGSQQIASNDSRNILEDVVRCLLDRDTSALGFQIAQGSDGICISYVEPNGPADRSGNIFVGDKIKELTITFENMPFGDALTILSCASSYKIRLELERAIINDANQPDYVAEEVDTSSAPSMQQLSSLYKSYSTSDLALRLKNTHMSTNKSVSGGSFMSKQKYQLPQQTAINTINEEVLPSTTPEIPSSSNNSCLNFTCKKNDLASCMTESVVSEETIIISDPTLPVLSERTSPNDLSVQLQSTTRAETYATSNCTSNSTPSNRTRQQTTPTMPSIPIPLNNEHTVLSLMPEENCKVNEINCNGFSEYVERTHFMYSNTSVKDSIQKNCMEFCELIEPKRDSIVIEFEEERKDDCCCYYEQQQQQRQQQQQHGDEAMVKLSNCNNTFDDEVDSNFHPANMNSKNSVPSFVEAPQAVAPTTAIKVGNERQPGSITDQADVERNITRHLPNKNDDADGQFRRMNVIGGKSEINFNSNIQFSNSSEQMENFVPANHPKLNEANNKLMMKSNKSINKSPMVERKTSDACAFSNENSRRSLKSKQLRKLSDSCGSNEIVARKEVRKSSVTAAAGGGGGGGGGDGDGDDDDDGVKDEGNNGCNISQKSGAKWSPKSQSHIPVITRTPSTKSKNKLPKVDGGRSVSNSAHNKLADDIVKNDMNGASLYIAKKEALRKTYLPFSKMAKSEEMDLSKERKARLEANQALLERQQNELRTLGILP